MPDVKEQNWLTNNTPEEVQMLGLLDKELHYSLKYAQRADRNVEKEVKKNGPR